MTMIERKKYTPYYEYYRIERRKTMDNLELALSTREQEYASIQLTLSETEDYTSEEYKEAIERSKALWAEIVELRRLMLDQEKAKKNLELENKKIALENQKSRRDTTVKVVTAAASIALGVMVIRREDVVTLTSKAMQIAGRVIKI